VAKTALEMTVKVDLVDPESYHPALRQAMDRRRLEL
jgi:hypothetical protein